MGDMRRAQSNLDKLIKKWLGKEVLRGEDGVYIFPMESTVAFASLIDWEDGDIVLSIFAPVLHQLRPTEALYRYVATESFMFGNLRVEEEDPSDVTLTFSCRLLANDLDVSELKVAVSCVAGTADRLDNELQPRFGGKRTDQLD